MLGNTAHILQSYTVLRAAKTVTSLVIHLFANTVTYFTVAINMQTPTGMDPPSADWMSGVARNSKYLKNYT